jgi:beta-glucanase (GH16 family)
MKNTKLTLQRFLSILIFMSIISCQNEDYEFGDIVAPSNLSLEIDIVGQDQANPGGDGSGIVNFIATADNALSYRFNFGDGTGDILAQQGINSHRFTKNGLNNYVVTLIVTGTGGISSSKSIDVSVFSNFNPIEVKNLLSGGVSSSKTWYWNAAVTGHLGVGPLEETDPSYYSASPYEKLDVGCLYEDQIIFTQDDMENISMELINIGNTYFHRYEVEDELGLPNPGEDTCYEYNTDGTNQVSFAPSESGIDSSISTQTSFVLQGSFMSYFLGNNDYEILSISENEMHVRIIQTEPSGAQLAWYQKFSTEDPLVDNNLETIYSNLFWEEDFNVDGPPNPEKWTYDIGTGSNGWGNNESQYYTNLPSNIIVEDGNLKITARAETYMGRNYTSARLKSENLFEFTNGRIDISAKLPEGGGTWPALWLLGANFDTVGWPECGEMDNMEHVGNNQNTIYGTLHYLGDNGNTSIGNTTNVPTASTEFHKYTIEWRPDEIIFATDDQVYFSFENTDDLPFNQDFFLILNIAMGGTLGGAIDPDFEESTMEIDYIKVYQ